MANMLSPGVSVTEMDFSDYVSSVSSCVVGIVGGARKGPTTPTLVTTPAQFISIFGEPVSSDYGAYSALAVLEKCDQVWYQRVLHGGSKASAGVVGTDKLTFTAVDEGASYNNVKVNIEGTDKDFTIKVSVNSHVTETFEHLSTTNSDTNYVTKVVNGHSGYINVTVNPTGTLTTKEFTLSGGTSGGAYATTGAKGSSKLVFRSKTFDSTLNGATVSISGLAKDGTFDVTLSKAGVELEVLLSLSIDPEDARYVETFVNTYSANLVAEYSNTGEEPFGKSFTLTSGLDGTKGLNKDDIVGIGDKGMQAFSNPEITDINVLLTPGWSDNAVVTEGIKICEGRGDCLYVIDSPFGLKPQQVVDWSNGDGAFAGSYTSIDSSYAAIYYPWVQVYDKFTKSKIWLPPSGYVAAQMAYNDAVGEQWFAPAGYNRGKINSVLDIEYSPTKGERDLLYGNRNVINTLVNFRGQGITIWGQKTAQRRPSATDRINVRRLMNMLKKIIAASTEYYLFEPNDETTWDKWVDMVEPKLESIKSRRGLYDFQVMMNEDTVTATDIDNYRMPGIIKVKPTRTAEYIPLSFMIMPNSAVFDE